MSTTFENDLQLEGHVAIGRQPDGVPLHVNSNAANEPNEPTGQFDKVIDSGTGGTHVALKGQTIATAGWNGDGGQLFGGTFEATTSGTGTGELFGFQAHAKVLNGATAGNEACGGEIDVVTEVPVNTRSGLFIGAMPSSTSPTQEGHQASGLDSMIVFINKEYAARWKAGITFLQASPTLSRFPIAPNGTIITATPTEPATVTNGIDFSDLNLTFSGHSIKVPGFSVSGAGLVTTTSPDAKNILSDPNGKSFSTRSSGSAWSVRDETAGADRLRIDTKGNLCLQAVDCGTAAKGVIGIPNGVEPTSSPADMVQLFSVDLSPGKATLGLRTEALVVAESVTSDRTLSVRINGTTYKLCLKAS